MHNDIIILSSFISFILVIITMPKYIVYIRKIKFGQIIRKEGPKDHIKKEGTPSMGGLIFILSSLAGLIIGLILLDLKEPSLAIYKKVILLILPFVSFGLIGFIDDFLIVKKKNNKGLSGNLKFFLQVVISVIFFFIFLTLEFKTDLSFFNLFSVDLKFVYGILILFILTGSSNAVNLTDGLDGLASGIMIIALSFFLYVAYIREETVIMIFIVTLISALVGFLFFNFKPAKIFMGDTGSLALGGALATLAIILKLEFFLIIIALPFIVETLSVMIQVTYFKATKGKRVFLMTPLHHHFELKGYSEKKVVYIFYTFALLCLVLAILIYRGVYA